MSENQEHTFIRYLQSLKESDQRGALADLRRGLGHAPGSAPQMYRYIIPRLPNNPPPWMEQSYYLVAALFASHPESTDKGDFGKHMAKARAEGNEVALERRFTALLSAHADDLPNYLRQAVSLLKSKDIPVNWTELLTNLNWWSHPEYGDRVRKRWATSFWGYQGVEEEKPSDASDG